jgi:hypothetical protein
MMTALRTAARKSTNPLDATMTKTQVVRRKFKSALPRTPENRELSALEAMARTMQLLDQLINETAAAGLDTNNVQAGLVYHQPRTKGEESVLARTIVVPPNAKEIGKKFVDAVVNLDKPRFLGVLFLQHDPDTDRAEYKNVLFVWPFLNGPDDAARLIAARNQQAKGGFKKAAN